MVISPHYVSILNWAIAFVSFCVFLYLRLLHPLLLHPQEMERSFRWMGRQMLPAPYIGRMGCCVFFCVVIFFLSLVSCVISLVCFLVEEARRRNKRTKPPFGQRRLACPHISHFLERKRESIVFRKDFWSPDALC